MTAVWSILKIVGVCFVIGGFLARSRAESEGFGGDRSGVSAAWLWYTFILTLYGTGLYTLVKIVQWMWNH